MKKNFMLSNVTKKVARVATGIAIAANTLLTNPTVAFATTTPAPAPSTGQTGIDTIDFGLGKLLGIFFGGISAIGLFVLGKAVIDFSGALPDRDTGTMKQATLAFLGGLMMAAIGGIISFLGFTY